MKKVDIEYTVVTSTVHTVDEETAYFTPSFAVKDDDGHFATVVMECGEDIAKDFFDGDALRLQEHMAYLDKTYDLFFNRLQESEKSRRDEKDVFAAKRYECIVDYYRSVVDDIMRQKIAIRVALEYIDRLYGPEEEVA